MRRFFALTFVLVLCGFGPLQTYTSYGNQAYTDIINNFWYGQPTNGQIQSPYMDGSFGSPVGRFTLFCNGCAWQYEQAANAIYAYWKATGSSDAASRISTQWYWEKAHFTLPVLQTCGSSTTMNGASDDAAWSVGFYLEAAEVTSDPDALTAASGLLTCMKNRWSDGGTAGCTGTGAAVGIGIWYDDTCDLKSSYQNIYALENYWYYQLSGDTSYRTYAIALDTWIAATLQRNGQTVQGQTFPNDGLYWAVILANGTIVGFSNPYQIAPANSNVFMGGDMAEDVLCARLYADTGITSYLTRLQADSVSTQTYFRDGNGSLIAMRDARTDGWAAYFYAHDIVLAGLVPTGGVSKTTYNITATASALNGRNTDFTYAGCWDGPASNASCIWATNAGLAFSEQVEISANDAIWPIANLILQ